MIVQVQNVRHIGHTVYDTYDIVCHPYAGAMLIFSVFFPSLTSVQTEVCTPKGGWTKPLDRGTRVGSRKLQVLFTDDDDERRRRRTRFARGRQRAAAARGLYRDALRATRAITDARTRASTEAEVRAQCDAGRATLATVDAHGYARAMSEGRRMVKELREMIYMAR
jgi:hypothetical protein